MRNEIEVSLDGVAVLWITNPTDAVLYVRSPQWRESAVALIPNAIFRDDGPFPNSVLVEPGAVVHRFFSDGHSESQHLTITEGKANGRDTA